MTGHMPRLRVHADAGAAGCDTGAVSAVSGAVVMLSAPDSTPPQRQRANAREEHCRRQ
jgi:hypothetical protein